MRRFAPVILLAALAACDRAETPAPAPEPAPVEAPPAPLPQPGDYSGDFNLLGTEPFWALEIRSGGLKLSQAGEADVTSPNPGPRVEGAKALWPGEGMVVTLTEGACSDGMSDRVYPWFAEVTTTTQTLKGCAVRPGAFDGEPRP